MNNYVNVLKKYAVFEGRAARKEYWMFFLFNVTIAVILSLIGEVIGFSFLTSIYMLAVLLPTLAVLARRLHDTDRSAWWILVGLIPFIGGFVLLVFTTLDSQASQNKYGPNPKGSSVTPQGKNPFIIIMIAVFVIALIMAVISILGFLSIPKYSQPTTVETST